MKRSLICLLAVLSTPALAQDILRAQAGYYHDATLPAQVLCPTQGTYISADGQVLTREIGASGVTTSKGYQCQASGEEILCASGEIVEGVLTLPPSSGAQTFVTLTDAGEGRVALAAMDGSGRPLTLVRCPEDFAALVPGAGPAEFAAPPPPADVDQAALDPAQASAAGWAASGATPLPFAGVFGLFPRTEQSEDLLRMIADAPPATIAALAAQYNVTEEDLSAARLEALITGEGCRTRPLAITSGGLMLELAVRGAGEDGVPEATLENVAACSIAADLLTCATGEKTGGIWRPGDGRRSVSWLVSSAEAGGPRLCNPQLGVDDPNACSELVACGADVLTFRVDGDQPLSQVIADFERE